MEILKQQDKSDDEKESKSLVKFFELIAYAGGMWYFITNFVFGPLSKLIQGDVLLNEQPLQVLDKNHSKIAQTPTKLDDQEDDKPQDTARPLKSEIEAKR